MRQVKRRRSYRRSRRRRDYEGRPRSANINGAELRWLRRGRDPRLRSRTATEMDRRRRLTEELKASARRLKGIDHAKGA